MLSLIKKCKKRSWKPENPKYFNWKIQIICRMPIKMLKYNPDRECKVLIVSDDMILDIFSKKTLSQIVTNKIRWYDSWYD